MPSPENKFKKAVDITKDVAGCHRNGLQALGNDSHRVSLSDPAKCGGSLNIDDCTQALYPQSNRWDYAIHFEAEVYFAEVHPAHTSEVKTVLNKLEWLKNWLDKNAPEIKKLRAANKPYFWIQTKNFDILKTSPQYRQLAQAGLVPVKKLKL